MKPTFTLPLLAAMSASTFPIETNNYPRPYVKSCNKTKAQKKRIAKKKMGRKTRRSQRKK